MSVVAELLEKRISDLRKDRLKQVADPKQWYKLCYTEDQLEFNKRLYFDVVKFPNLRSKGGKHVVKA